MANRLMTKSEANDYCMQNGYKLFIDLCMREKVIIQPDPPTKQKIMCDCSCSDECPQGKMGMSGRCIIWKEINQK